MVYKSPDIWFYIKWRFLQPRDRREIITVIINFWGRRVGQPDGGGGVIDDAISMLIISRTLPPSSWAIILESVEQILFSFHLLRNETLETMKDRNKWLWTVVLQKEKKEEEEEAVLEGNSLLLLLIKTVNRHVMALQFIILESKYLL